MRAAASGKPVNHYHYVGHASQAVFVATMALLVAINLSKGEPYWILWVLFGWGIGLLAHWWFALGPGKAETT